MHARGSISESALHTNSPIWAHSTPAGWFLVSANREPPYPTWRTRECRQVWDVGGVPLDQIIGRLGDSWIVEA